MPIDDDLRAFVKEALGRGTPRPVVAELLQRAGWRTPEIEAALAGFADVEFPVPVPRPKPHVSARDAFLYLVLFSTLYVSAFQFGSLLFQFIELALPDPAAPDYASRPDYVASRLRWAVASLIVSLPVFLYVSALTRREVRVDVAKRGAGVRRWLTYLTLFVAALVLIADVTSLVFGLLGGELTIQIVLKSFVIGAIAGGVFGYYLWDVRGDQVAPRP